MASLFERYRTPSFVPPYKNEEWDNVRKAIRENRKDIDKELMSYALAFMARSPQFAALVPFLSSEIGIIPNANLDGTVNLVEGLLRDIRINRNI